MKFSYYKKLKSSEKKIYDASDRVSRIRFRQPGQFNPYVTSLQKTLAAEDRSRIEKASQKLAATLCQVCKVPAVKVKVLSKRPSHSWGELHGLYEQEEDEPRPVITLWMRTAVKKDVVSFKTFLRTLVHEFVHHLDFEHFKFEDSFHTEGFYKRESSVLRQLL